MGIGIRRFGWLLVLLVMAGAAHAADLKVGFVDAERVNRESAPAEDASKRLEKEFQPRVQEIQRRETQIKGLQTQFEKDALTMSETDRRNREQELSRQIVDVQRLQREFQEDLNLRRNQELGSLLERANKIIRQVRFDFAGSRLSQPAHRHYRARAEGARRRPVKRSRAPRC
jgi:outer membrane protein